MARICKLLLIASAILLVSLTGYLFYDRQFKLSNVKGDWPSVEYKVTTEAQKAYLQEVFLQPFRYLDRGKQSYVFVSQDGRTVLKLFDNRCLRSGSFPFFFSIKKKRCEKKLKQLFKGYQIAAADDVDHSGVLYLQLASDHSYSLFVTLKDRFGITHHLDVAEVPFALQETAISLRHVMTTLLNEGKVEEAKQLLHQIIDMYVEEYRRGILDSDHNFMYNTGFVNGRPIRIDVGRLQKDWQTFGKVVRAAFSKISEGNSGRYEKEA
jgi:hypothetical protein